MKHWRFSFINSAKWCALRSSHNTSTIPISLLLFPGSEMTASALFRRVSRIFLACLLHESGGRVSFTGGNEERPHDAQLGCVGGQLGGATKGAGRARLGSNGCSATGPGPRDREDFPINATLRLVPSPRDWDRIHVDIVGK